MSVLILFVASVAFGIVNQDAGSGDPIVAPAPEQPAPEQPAPEQPAPDQVPPTTGPVQEMLDNCHAGVIEECAGVLDILDVECAEGDLLSCDLLYLASPTDSDYLWHGGTCDWYFEDLTYAGICNEP
jgi:hypothetical protein